MIDTHCHIDFKNYNEDRDNVIKRAFDGGLAAMVTIGCDLESSKNALLLSEKYKNIYATAGIHPNEVISENYNWESFLDFVEENNNGLIGFGETGLDYYRIPENKDVEFVKKLQKEVFIKHIDLGKKYKKPISIHSRDAIEDIVDIMKEQKPYKSVLHCFVEDINWANEILQIDNCMISFGGILTFPNAGKLQEVAQKIPLEKILIETDSPFLSPVPYRGKRNEPLYVKYVVEKIAELKNISFEKVVEVTTKNAIEFWGMEK